METETPPLTRGILRVGHDAAVARGNTPARAGNTTSGRGVDPDCRKHPRLRGEYRIIVCAVRRAMETPPLARGILLLPKPKN